MIPFHCATIKLLIRSKFAKYIFFDFIYLELDCKYQILQALNNLNYIGFKIHLLPH